MGWKTKAVGGEHGQHWESGGGKEPSQSHLWVLGCRNSHQQFLGCGEESCIHPSASLQGTLPNCLPMWPGDQATGSTAEPRGKPSLGPLGCRGLLRAGWDARASLTLYRDSHTPNWSGWKRKLWSHPLQAGSEVETKEQSQGMWNPLYFQLSKLSRVLLTCLLPATTCQQHSAPSHCISLGKVPPGLAKPLTATSKGSPQNLSMNFL